MNVIPVTVAVLFSMSPNSKVLPWRLYCPRTMLLLLTSPFAEWEKWMPYVSSSCMFVCACKKEQVPDRNNINKTMKCMKWQRFEYCIVKMFVFDFFDGIYKL